MAVPNAALITLYWSVNGTLVMNRIGAIVAAGTTFNTALANLVGSAIKGSFTTNLASQCPSSTQLIRLGVRDIRQDNLPEYRDTAAAAPGTGTGDALPAGLAICVTIRTALSGQSYRGRMYVSGFSEGANGPTGTCSTTTQNAVLSFMNGWQTGLGAAGLQQAIVSMPSERKVTTRTTYHGDGTTTVETLSDEKAKAGIATGISAFEIRNANWEHQRRRDNGRGLPPAQLDALMRQEVVR